jgi:hypothetical protein
MTTGEKKAMLQIATVGQQGKLEFIGVRPGTKIAIRLHTVRRCGCDVRTA